MDLGTLTRNGYEVFQVQGYKNDWSGSRNGFEVFYSQGYKNDWSGTRNGSPLPEGSYYYRIDLEGKGSIEFEGWLYLSR